jgi:hypothetical protein
LPPVTRRHACETAASTCSPSCSRILKGPLGSPPRAGSATPAVRLCRSGARRCRAKPLTVTLRLDRAAPVTAQIQRRDCRRARCRYVTAATLRLRARPGANRLTVGARGATARLRAGAYRLRVVAGAAGAASVARTLSFRVR